MYALLGSIMVAALVLGGCGREPSRLLRQGQLSIYDFPLYLTTGSSGNVIKIERDRTQSIVASNLNDPRGVTTDRFGNLYIAEYGAGRILKISAGSSTIQVVAENLVSPSVLATDSFGEVYIAEDGTKGILRLSDRKSFGTYNQAATAMVFGVDDIPIIGFYAENRVVWGFESDKETSEINAPVNAAIDGTGRVYIAEGDANSGKIYRFNQREPELKTLVADGLVGAAGIAVDLVGNIFLVEQGAGRILLVTYEGKAYSWVSGLTDPQYLSFTQY